MKRVLVVDDQPDCSEPMARLLRLCGFSTAIAADGRAALGLLDKFGPNLVLLDLAMPGMDGFEFLRVVRGMPQWTDLPVMVLRGTLPNVPSAGSEKTDVSKNF